jgi:serine/threonine protein kinase
LAERSTPVSLDRAILLAHVERTLHRGGWGNPDVLLARVDGHPVVVKDYAPRAFLVRHTLGRWLTAREQRAHRRVADLDAVPNWLGRVDGLAFALEYRPGRALARSLAPSLPPDFLARLERSVAEMHARGIVHLDLRHRSNILADERGAPVLLDFASALRFRPGGWPSRWLMPWIAAIDRRALGKWRERLVTTGS